MVLCNNIGIIKYIVNRTKNQGADAPHIPTREKNILYYNILLGYLNIFKTNLI